MTMTLDEDEDYNDYAELMISVHYCNCVLRTSLGRHASALVNIHVTFCVNGMEAT